MLLDMTIANFRSVQSPQTISFEGLRDNRLDDAKTVQISERLKVIRSVAIIGPNGAGKSTFVRALEALKSIVLADLEDENPLLMLAGTSFAYSETKGAPADLSLDIILGEDEESGQPLIGRYTLVADRQKVFLESYYLFVGRSRKLMFERKYVNDDQQGVATYKYRWGKMFRGDKKRLVNKVKPNHTYLAAAALRESLSLTPLYTWFKEALLILPFGLSAASEKQLVVQLTKNPQWKKQLVDFLWSIDITDIRDVRVQDERLVFVHTNVTQHYASYFSNESLSLRRLSTIAIAMFEAFTNQRLLVMDDFGMLLHPYALEHLVAVFEESSKKSNSQMLVIDCNPSLLKDGVLRRDGVWFAQKSSESATEFFSLADFKFTKAKRDLAGQLYLNGSYGALPITSEYIFIDEKKEQ
ncbi:MAG: AAA family ATPase [Sphaerochaetaceae bacterium]